MFAAMVNRHNVILKGIEGKILAIELEDGSGHNFNVVIITKENKTFTVFVKG
jgi:hypothetical protein